jgi:Ca2+-binding EF-hand superfamily protein
MFAGYWLQNSGDRVNGNVDSRLAFSRLALDSGCCGILPRAPGKETDMTTRTIGTLAAGLILATAMATSNASAHEHEHGMMMGNSDMMAKMDTNHDGKVSAAEHTAYAKAMFDKMDTNQDGFLTKDEIEAGMKAMHKEHEEHEDRKDKDEHEHGEHEHGMMKGSSEMLAKMDTDHDGKVSAAEHAAYAQEMFDKMDTNHDGFLTKDEMEAGMKAMHKEHEEHEDKDEHDASPTK